MERVVERKKFGLVMGKKLGRVKNEKKEKSRKSEERNTLLKVTILMRYKSKESKGRNRGKIYGDKELAN
jgi:hypothetical protein